MHTVSFTFGPPNRKKETLELGGTIGTLRHVMAETLVLVAEDDKALNMVHRTMLEDEGIKMKVVENGMEAVKAIDELKPTLVLLDLLMPQMDGFAVLRHIQEKKYTFPVVVLTNLSSENDRRECMNLGATDVYVKSDTDIEQLKQIIKKYVKA